MSGARRDLVVAAEDFLCLEWGESRAPHRAVDLLPSAIRPLLS